MREVDEIGATCTYLALCESVLCTDSTAEQFRALVSPVTCIATRVCAPRRCTASTGEGRSMLWPPSRARIESYEKTFAEGGLLPSFLRTSLSNTLCVRRRPEARRPLPHSDDSGPPGHATPPHGPRPSVLLLAPLVPLHCNTCGEGKGARPGQFYSCMRQQLCKGMRNCT